MKMLNSLWMVGLLALPVAWASQVAWDASAFDPYEDDVAYVDLALEGETLTLSLASAQGNLPYSMEGSTLPLDEDFVASFLNRDTALAEYAGLPYEIEPRYISVTVDGDREAIPSAMMDRLTALGLTVTPTSEGGPVETYDLTRGDHRWALAVIDRGLSATFTFTQYR